MAASWTQAVETTFASDPQLIKRIIDSASRYQNELPQLFHDISQYFTNGSASQTSSKKRKLEIGVENATSNGYSADTIATPTTSFECKNVSFQIPARKKLKLQVVNDGGDVRKSEIRLIDPKTESLDHVLSTSNIDAAFCLPVPEKQQRQWNFCIFPHQTSTTPTEQLVFTMNETKPDDATSINGPFPEGSTYISAMGSELNALLHEHGKQVTLPDESEFASSIPQPHRKGEKAYHVKAHRGSKEGYLFFLPTGIIFGFRKPVTFFPFSAIEAISYTSVLQRTFNLVISVAAFDDPTSSTGEQGEVEFSMLDQADFAGIDTYVKRHGLNDASMAAGRKARVYNVNKERGGKENGVGGEGEGVVDGDGDGGMQDARVEVENGKTEQELQDEEDEEEEDYEASGGESDGEGESSEEEEGGEEVEFEEDGGDEEEGDGEE